MKTILAIDLPHGKNCWTKKHLQQLEKMNLPFENIDNPGDLWCGQLSMELKQFNALHICLQQTTEKLDQLNKNDDPVKLLQTAPGMGPRTSEAVVAIIDDPHRFRNCRQVCNYAGLTPRRYQSGETDRSGRISKRGNPCDRSSFTDRDRITSSLADTLGVKSPY